MKSQTNVLERNGSVKVIGILVLLLVLIGGGYLVYRMQMPVGELKITTESATWNGEIACLPNIPAENTECHLGLKSTEGRYYELRNLSEQAGTFEKGVRVRVSGVMANKEPGTPKYDVEGIIQISSIVKI